MSLPFGFAGPLPPSKSLLIRYLLLRLYEPRIAISQLSECDDVRLMCAATSALTSSAAEPIVDCGEAGLVLRLCMAYASRRGGRFALHGSPRLLARPHAQLVQALHALGAQVVASPSHDALLLHSPAGWQEPRAPLPLTGGPSSQFASALILNAWDLPFALRLEIGHEPVSHGYLTMSIAVAQQLGMHIDREPNGVLSIPAQQRIVPQTAPLEADVSSAFSVAALAAVAGRAHITNFPQRSLQPDAHFVDLLRQMGVPLRLDEHGLFVDRAPDQRLRPLHESVADWPDLVPVLAVLCGLADGASTLFGAPHLRGKESDRIATSAALLRLLDRPVEERADGLHIHGRPFLPSDGQRPLHFDAGRDHRLVMAAAVARRAGFVINIAGQQAVDKSFPEFRAIALGS